MAKQDEIAYALRMNAGHAVNKPFSDSDCGRNLIRIGTLLTLLPPAPARVLDLGCGTGWTSLFFARAGYEVVGVDIAPEMVRLAEEQRDATGLRNLSFHLSDYEGLNFRDEFDAAVFFDSLHHAEDERVAISRAFAALKPGGVLLADEPGEGHSKAESSVVAVAEHGVTEKDMPPAHVVALGREAGFTGFRVFPHSHELSASVYARRAAPRPDPFADTDSAARRSRAVGWRKRLNHLRERLSRIPPWRLQNVDHLLVHVRSNGLVMMWKALSQEARRAA